ncbi:hypothetical protein IQ260_16750 [Leptolyngbya cf. ectocarpi LEGE 11479]|uniref:Uncharacterized protein n=1 Tax=Leptolyngbya cf. ectocarpi LEGE 11479 TaxID=1828722 RepID=A0A929FB00_LEPEC|nr:hypothetical protein [Leptolyngbya ectocarpi]MBE9068303.1 hypothetical protein [Leptolyngbya cf. ectocarpi LEGE 11479]
MEELLQQASATLTQFAQAHCGPNFRITKRIQKGLFGIGSRQITLKENYWNVSVEYTREFSPDGKTDLRQCAILDFQHIPMTSIWILLNDPEHYTVRIMTELKIPGLPKSGLIIAREDIIEAQSRALWELLDRYLWQGLLVKDGNKLRYPEQP